MFYICPSNQDVDNGSRCSTFLGHKRRGIRGVESHHPQSQATFKDSFTAFSAGCEWSGKGSHIVRMAHGCSADPRSRNTAEAGELFSRRSNHSSGHIEHKLKGASPAACSNPWSFGKGRRERHSGLNASWASDSPVHRAASIQTYCSQKECPGCSLGNDLCLKYDQEEGNAPRRNQAGKTTMWP